MPGKNFKLSLEGTRSAVPAYGDGENDTMDHAIHSLTDRIDRRQDIRMRIQMMNWNGLMIYEDATHIIRILSYGSNWKETRVTRAIRSASIESLLKTSGIAKNHL